MNTMNQILHEMSHMMFHVVFNQQSPETSLDILVLTRSMLASMEYSKAESVRVSMGGMVQGGMLYSPSRM